MEGAPATVYCCKNQMMANSLPPADSTRSTGTSINRPAWPGPVWPRRRRKQLGPIEPLFISNSGVPRLVENTDEVRRDRHQSQLLLKTDDPCPSEPPDVSHQRSREGYL